ncbi:MAG: hypothetical protein SNF33_01045 [Candidatus Algichlamydia australiensis]|nr:hypothetical protein [Chlamydiales bacterium]
MNIKTVQNFIPKIDPKFVQGTDAVATIALVAANVWTAKEATQVNKFGVFTSAVVVYAGIKNLFDTPRKSFPAQLFYSFAILNVLTIAAAKVHHYAKHDADLSFFQEVDKHVYKYNPFSWKLEDSWFFCGERYRTLKDRN